jgi:hypothetical protein
MRNSASRLLMLLQRLEVHKSFGTSSALKFLGQQTDKRSAAEQGKIGIAAMKVLQDTYEDFLRDMRTIYRHQDQVETLLEGLKPVELFVFQPNLNAAVTVLDASAIALLKVCAASMPEEVEITGDEFKELRTCLDSLRNLSKTAKPALRNVLLELVRVAEESIALYEVRGASGLKKALKQMWGELAEIWRIHPGNADEEAEKKTAMESAKDFILKFDALYAKAVKYVPLLEHAVPLLMNNTPTP